MVQLYLKKMPGGSLVPDNDETTEALQKIKVGTVLRGDFKKPRNYRFLQKTMVLIGVAYDYFTEQMEMGREYHGQVIKPSKEQFRKELIILAGHYTPTFDIRGNVTLEAKSLSFGNCSEEEAERIYSDLIQACLTHVCGEFVNQEQLQRSVDDILRFA